MPVLYFSGDIDAVSLLHLNCFFSLFLVISSSTYAYQNLCATIFRMMDMPVITAPRLKGYIKYTNLFLGNRSKITLSDKIFCIFTE